MNDRVYPKSPRVGVGAVVFQNSDILLVKRKSEPKSDFWTLPGGMVELGETMREAVIREVWEECGIEIEPLRVVDVLDYIEQDSAGKIKFHYLLIDFEARYLQGDLKPGSDVSDAKWFRKDRLHELRLPDMTRSFLGQHFKL